jgi:hypothetical protein
MVVLYHWQQFCRVAQNQKASLQ